MVLDNPWFTVPDDRGAYEIAGVPPGTWTVTAWHERVRPLSTEVKIEADRTTRLDLRIPLAEATGGRVPPIETAIGATGGQADPREWDTGSSPA